MGNPVTQFQRPFEGSAAQVEIAVFCTDVFAAVALLFNGEGRGERFVEDIDGFETDFDVSGVDFGVLAGAFDHCSRRLNHEFAPEGGGGFHQCGVGISLHHELCDSITVAKVNEGHASEFTAALHPSGQRHLFSNITYAEFSAGIASVHYCEIIIYANLCFFRKLSNLSALILRSDGNNSVPFPVHGLLGTRRSFRAVPLLPVSKK